jgi:hypothetical protein
MPVTVTPRVENAQVLVDVNAIGGGGGESLEYEILLPDAGVGNFILLDRDSSPANTILSSKLPPTGPFEWRRIWPVLGDPLALLTSHNFAFHFAEATKYTYRCTLVRTNGTRVPVLDMDFESDDPGESHLQALSVILF